MAVTEKMKSVLRRTMGGQNTGDAPFNAASQGGYRNMAKQIAGGAKMSAGGLARAQQGVASQSLGAPITADDTTKEAAGLALQRYSGSPAALDSAAQRRLGQVGGSLSPGVMAQQAAAQTANARQLAPAQAAIPNMTGQTFTKGLTPGLNIDMSTAKYFGGAGNLSPDATAALSPVQQAGQRLQGAVTGTRETSPAIAAALSPVQEAGQRLQGATTSTRTMPGASAGTSNYGLPGLDAATMTGEGEAPAGYGTVTPGAQLSGRPGTTSATDATGATLAGARGAGAAVQDTGDMVEQAIRDLLMGGLRDTTAEENLVREMMQAQQQQALVDQRARAGRAGLVQTGAQAGIEADIRQQAAQQALREIMGIQSEARGERRADIGLAGQLYGTDAALAAEEARTSAMLQALEQMYGGGQAAEMAGGRQGSLDEGQAQDLLTDLGVDMGSLEEGNFADRFSPLNNLTTTYTDARGTLVRIYQRPDGTYFKLTGEGDPNKEQGQNNQFDWDISSLFN